MGMAASQARYLAIVARKSNCEYEGQQINQARTALSNQSANLFNQMLGLSVPVPPSTQDFTKVQYSFMDGAKGATIDSWEQLPYSDPDYNYVVRSHYTADVYTGAQKKLTDPQVQVSNGAEVSSSKVYAALKEMTDKKATMEADQTESLAKKTVMNMRLEALNLARATANTKQVAYDKAVENLNLARAEAAQATEDKKNLDNYIYSTFNVTKAEKNSENNNYNVEAGVSKYEYETIDNIKKSEDAEIIFERICESLNALIDNGVTFPGNDPATSGWKYTYGLDPVSKEKKFSPAVPQVCYDRKTGTIAFTDDLEALLPKKDADGKPVVPAETLNTYNIDTTANANSIVYNAQKLDTAEKVAKAKVSSLEAAEQIAKSELDLAKDSIPEANLAYEASIDDYETATEKQIQSSAAFTQAEKAYNELNRPTYVGNCKLTPLAYLDKDQETELRQIAKDMKEKGIKSGIVDCFDGDNNYIGGAYSFTLNGNTYYVSHDELLTAHYEETVGNNQIDGEVKMPYYNATYIKTNVEQVRRALLETDETGRFKSVRFEDDSTSYPLSMETITDDVAYQDAMNQYYYENAKYDKMIQDINAKTSIIQQQDRTLELRLKQLDTEHNALQQEMEAVSAVVKKNVETSFKAFSG